MFLKLHLLGEDQKVKAIRKISFDPFFFDESCFQTLLKRVEDLFNLKGPISLFYKGKSKLGMKHLYTKREKMSQ